MRSSAAARLEDRRVAAAQHPPAGDLVAGRETQPRREVLRGRPLASCRPRTRRRGAGPCRARVHGSGSDRRRAAYRARCERRRPARCDLWRVDASGSGAVGRRLVVVQRSRAAASISTSQSCDLGAGGTRRARAPAAVRRRARVDSCPVRACAHASPPRPCTARRDAWRGLRDRARRRRSRG